MYKQFINKIGLVDRKSSCLVYSKYMYGTDKTTSEAEIRALLELRFPKAKAITVEDVSGGCGAMYDIFIETSEFEGLSIVKQHQSVTNTLKDQIKLIHGLRIVTKSA